MDAVEYIKEAKRICKSRSVCKSVSGKCPLLDENGHCTATADICAADIIEKTEKSVHIVEQWAKGHPVKTRQSEFLKQFPDARVNDDGILCLIPCCIEDSLRDKCGSRKCGYCRKAYWLEEVDE